MMGMTGPPAWMLWFGLGGVQVRTAHCTEAARDVSGCTLCKVQPTAMPEHPEEKVSYVGGFLMVSRVQERQRCWKGWQDGAQQPFSSKHAA